MGRDPFREAFERDYLSVTDLVHMYGTGRDVSLRISQFGMRDTVKRGGQRGQAMKEAKPVIWFVEHPGKPVYLSRGAFETLLERFGDGYWLPEERDRILYAPQKIRLEDAEGGNANIRFNLHFIRGPYNDHREKLGAENQTKILAAVEPLGWTRDRFRMWIRQEHPDLVGIVDSAESIADMPRLMAPVLDHWRREAKSDASRRPPAEPSPPAERSTPAERAGKGLPPRGRREDDGYGSPGFGLGGRQPEIGPDDIPF